MPNKSNWDSYQSCLRTATRLRDAAIYFARYGNDWVSAFARAESAKTAQAKADEYFERYLDALALNDACDGYNCISCQRSESDCSRNPCDAVKADRIS